MLDTTDDRNDSSSSIRGGILHDPNGCADTLPPDYMSKLFVCLHMLGTSSLKC